jgi:3-methylfumaryl-CoA hydratase
MNEPLRHVEELSSWVGRQEIVEDLLCPGPAAALAATLDQPKAPQAGDALPPLWHWVYFLNYHPHSQLAADGHMKRGGFVPPVPLPRRMFAGAKLTFLSPLTLGERARRVSTIRDLTPKKGRTGDLVFLRIHNEMAGPRGPAIIEEQDIVYREAPGPGVDGERPAPARPQPRADWSREVRADEALLFRYSALIFNAHRIHYDRPYATEHEGYDGLVVHGQLVATMLAELVRANVHAPLKAFSFRAMRPILDIAPFRIFGARDGARVSLWAEDDARALAMEAEAELAA